MRLSQTVNVGKSNWIIIGGRIVRWIIEDTKAGISQDEKPEKFKGYTKGYRIFKKSGKFGRGSKLFGQSKDTQISPPNLNLTGSTWRSFHVNSGKTNNESVVLTWRDGDKIIQNSDRGRYTRNAYGVNDPNMEKVADEISKVHGRNLRKWAKEDITIDVGFK